MNSILGTQDMYSAYDDPNQVTDDGYDDDNDDTDTILLRLVQNYDWKGAMERIREYPEECQAIGSLGRTPLHVACDHDAPAAVIQALTQAYPQAVLEVGTTNMNPLHIVCSSEHASVEVVRLLSVESGADLAKKMAFMKDADGDTPLHSACRCGASLEVIKLLLLICPRAVHERDDEGLTPLLRLWVREFVLLGNEAIEGVQGLSDLTGELGEAWKKTMLLLYCAYMGSLRLVAPPPSSGASVSSGGSVDYDKIFRPLHAMAAFDCPRRIVRMATIVYKDQLLIRDECGRTPLLVASQAPIYKFQDIADDGSDLDDMLEDHLYGDDKEAEEGKNQIDDMDVSFQENLTKPLPSVIDILLAAEPAASKVADPIGKLPLQYAMETGKKWNEGVQALTEAEGKSKANASAESQTSA